MYELVQFLQLPARKLLAIENDGQVKARDKGNYEPSSTCSHVRVKLLEDEGMMHGDNLATVTIQPHPNQSKVAIVLFKQMQTDRLLYKSHVILQKQNQHRLL